MKKLLKAAALPVLFAASSFASAGTLVVDLFDGAVADGFEQLTVDDTADGSAVIGTEYGPDFAGILGGYRDVSVNCVSGCVAGTNIVSAVAITNPGGTGGVFNFSNASGVAGQARIDWDGQGTGLGAAGLGGVDFSTFASFEVDVISSDGGSAINSWQFTVIIEDLAGNTSAVTLQANQVSAPGAINFISLDLFSLCGASGGQLVSVVCAGGPVDLTQVNKLSALLNVNGLDDVDLRLRGVQLVPEPGMMSIMGLGLLMMGFFARRKRLQA